MPPETPSHAGNERLAATERSRPGRRTVVVPTGGVLPRTALTGSLRWFVVAAPGLEEVVRAEAAALPGATAARLVKGGVELDGGLEVGMRANLHLRAATRVLVRVGEVKAREFPALRRKLAALPWGSFVRPGERVKVGASAAKSRLYHTGGIEEQLWFALADAGVAAVKEPPHGGDDGEGDPEVLRVMIRGENDLFTVSVDSSGELLHRRGWRTEAGKAPLRETLAAGMLSLAGFDPAEPFVDPMCGAGTFALEACALALRIPPGLRRTFAFERWPGFDAAVWRAIVAEAEGSVLTAGRAPIAAFDRDARVVEIARRNAARAGMSAHVAIEQAALGERAAPEGKGLVLLNPPYGRRLQAGGQARLGRDIVRALRARFSGWRAGVVVADPAMEQGLGVRPRAVFRLVNGGMKVKLVLFDVNGARA